MLEACSWHSPGLVSFPTGRCPSGQRKQTVNLPAQPTGVQIPPGPLNLVPGLGDRTGHFICMAHLERRQ